MRPGRGEAEKGSAVGRDGCRSRGQDPAPPAPTSPRWEGKGLTEAPRAKGGDTLAPVIPVEQRAGAKGQD